MTNSKSTLSFGKTYTIAKFKAKKGIESINIVHNSKKDTHFMTDESGDILGSVSSFDDSPVITRVTGDEGKFWLMHNKGKSNVVASF